MIQPISLLSPTNNSIRTSFILNKIIKKIICHHNITMSSSSKSHADFKIGSPSLSDYAKKLHKAMDKAQEGIHKHPPTELISFVKANLQPTLEVTNKTIKLFGHNDLETIHDIAHFGDQDLKTILQQFPMSFLVDKEFISFIKQVFLLSKFFKEIGESIKNKDSALLTPNLNNYLDYLPNTFKDTVRFINSIDTKNFQHSVRFNKHHLDGDLQKAIGELILLVEAGSDPIIGSSLSITSWSSRGGVNDLLLNPQNAPKITDHIRTHLNHLSHNQREFKPP